MFKLKSEVQFDMAHYLSGYNGKCSNIHGHRYRLIAKVGSETLHEEGQCRGMVDDFSNFKNALKVIENTFENEESLSRLGENFRSFEDELSVDALPFASRLFYRAVESFMSFWDWLRGKIREANNVLTLYCPIADEITLDCKI